MRRFLFLLLILLFGWGVVTAVFAQINTEEPEETTTPAWASLPPAEQSILLEAMDLGAGGYLPLGDDNAASDSCGSATNVTFTGTAVGGTTTVTDMGVEPDDPELGCMWGSPQSNQGYRTAWYQFVAPNNGTVTIDTVSSNYDTVVGVFTGFCGSLTAVACNDDFNGFSSRVTFNIKQGQTYYVEIVDWNASGSGTKTLNAFMQSEPIDSQWEQLSNPNQTPARTAATAVSYGSAFYQFGGQLNSGNLGGAIYKYETVNNTWSQWGSAQLQRRYFSAVRVGSNVYLPGGDTSADTVDAAITNSHVYFDLNSSTPSPIARANLPTPVAWSQSVAVPGQNNYYVIGGLGDKWDIYPTIDISETVTAYNTVWKYNIGSNNWTTEATTMLTPRFGHTAAYVAGKICVMGGLNNNLELLVSGECWSPGGSSSFVPSTKIPRYGAASAIAPDGRWFIFGGIDSTQNPVSEVEVWDPNLPNPSWKVLNVSYDLGGSALNPPRTRPQGGFIGYNLYAFGGGIKDANSNPGANTLVERLYSVGGNYNYLPLVVGNDDTTFDDNFSKARPIAVSTAQNGRFYGSTDFYSAYTFQIYNTGSTYLHLANIPSGSDYNLYLYNSDKGLIGLSENGGNNNENIALTLVPGRYYIMVERIYGPSGGSSGFYIRVTQ